MVNKIAGKSRGTAGEINFADDDGNILPGKDLATRF